MSPEERIKSEYKYWHLPDLENIVRASGSINFCHFLKCVGYTARESTSIYFGLHPYQLERIAFSGGRLKLHDKFMRRVKDFIMKFVNDEINSRQR